LTVGIGKRQHQVLESKRVNAYMLENCGNYALAGDWKMISSYMAHKVLATVCMLEIWPFHSQSTLKKRVKKKKKKDETENFFKKVLILTNWVKKEKEKKKKTRMNEKKKCFNFHLAYIRYTVSLISLCNR